MASVSAWAGVSDGVRGRASRRRAGSSASGWEASAQPPASSRRTTPRPSSAARQGAQAVEHLVLLGAQRVGELGGRHGVGREEEQRLQIARQAHDAACRARAGAHR